MNIYRVDGIRHQTVAFGATPETGAIARRVCPSTRTANGRATEGRHGRGLDDPAPDPPPFTTLAWRIIHMATCKLMYYEYAFGPGQLTWDELVLPHTVADAIAWLEEHHARLYAALDGLSDGDLDELRLTNWGEPWPTWRIFWVMAAHDLHHGGEIGCRRDLYRARQSRRMT